MHDVLEQFKKEGIRITHLRQFLVDFFAHHEKPCSVQDILKFLKKKKCLVNKTTVYREIDFLLRRKVIRELQWGERRSYYEWNQVHHHHVICRGCHVVEDVDLKLLESMLPKVEHQLASKMKFSQLQHSLEFFGLCQSCT